MAGIRIFSVFSNLPTFSEFARFVSAWAGEMVQQFNGNIEFVKNIKAAGPYTVTITSGETLAIHHTLGRIATGYLLIFQDQQVALSGVDNETYPWDKDTIYISRPVGGGSTVVKLYVI